MKQTASKLGLWEIIINVRELEAQKYAKFMQKGTSSIEKLMIRDFSLNPKGKLRQDLEYIMLRNFHL